MTAASEHEIAVDPRYAALRQVDLSLRNVRGKSGQALLDALDQLTEAVFNHCELPREESAPPPRVDDLFADNIAARHRRFIAVCLVRLLASNAEPFDNQRFRVAAFRLFESALPDLYNALRIDPARQTFEKQQQLADAAPAAEAAVSRVIGDLQSFADIPQFRTDLMKTLNHPSFKPILSEFIPPLIARNSINSALHAAEEVVESPEHLRVNAFRAATETLRVLRTRAAEIGTGYCDDLVVSLADRVHEVLEAEIAELVGRPAAITMRLAEKKYPLHVDGAHIDLQVEIANAGPGDAYDVSLRLGSSDGLEIEASETETSLGNWPRRALVVPICASVVRGTAAPAIEAEVRWQDADGTPQSLTEILVPEAQRPDVNWDELGDPYPLDAVASEDQLVGRDEILGDLLALLSGETMGSALVTGQKRVGKTSIVRTLETRLSRDAPSILAAYLEIGGYGGGGDITTTVKRLGPVICRRFMKADPALMDMKVPTFEDGSLTPAIEFFDEVRSRISNRRVLLILDEFDELPSAFFASDDSARSFFLTLRTLTSEPDFAVILVGGEKMRFVLSAHGDTLNRFENFPVDYFDITNNWRDFNDLVRRPTANVLEFAEDAVAAVYEASAGHPFFAKMICQQVAREARLRRDAHVTRPDIESALQLALAAAPAPRFQHFWTDGVAGSDENREYIKASRVKLLLALAQVLRRKPTASLSDLSLESQRFGLTDTEAQARVREFVERRILGEDQSGAIRPRIPFFAQWLIEYGAREIVTEVGGTDPVLEQRRREEETLIRPDEIGRVAGRWHAYRGTPPSAEDVRSWLAQFGDVFEQRLMFSILESLDFYATRRLEEIFGNLHARTLKRTQERSARDGALRSDILVTYFGGPGKSGAEMARIYRRVNEIDYNNVVDPSELPMRAKAPRVKAIIFVDDFVGSGEGLTHSIENLDTDLIRVADERGIDLYIGIAVGFDHGFARVREKIKNTAVKLRLLEGNTLTDADRVFSDTSRFFENPDDRLRAQAIVNRIGTALEKEHPLGYENSQAAVVFGTACPNNSLPILWKAKGDWRPLFPRH